MTGELAFNLVASALAPSSNVLDVGAGAGEHARRFGDSGHRVTAMDLAPPRRGRLAGWVSHDIRRQPWAFEAESFDLVWCSHVLEHVHDVGATLEEMRRVLRLDGLLAVTVPPLKHAIVGGHVNLFNLGLLAYRLILAGFDCSEASFGRYGYNLSAIVRRRPVPNVVLSCLRHDKGDIEALAKHFPVSWAVEHGFDGAAVPNCGLFAER